MKKNPWDAFSSLQSAGGAPDPPVLSRPSGLGRWRLGLAWLASARLGMGLPAAEERLRSWQRCIVGRSARSSSGAAARERLLALSGGRSQVLLNFAGQVGSAGGREGGNGASVGCAFGHPRGPFLRDRSHVFRTSSDPHMPFCNRGFSTLASLSEPLLECRKNRSKNAPKHSLDFPGATHPVDPLPLCCLFNDSFSCQQRSLFSLLIALQAFRRSTPFSTAFPPLSSFSAPLCSLQAFFPFIFFYLSSSEFSSPALFPLLFPPPAQSRH